MRSMNQTARTTWLRRITPLLFTVMLSAGMNAETQASTSTVSPFGSYSTTKYSYYNNKHHRSSTTTAATTTTTTAQATTTTAKATTTTTAATTTTTSTTTTTTASIKSLTVNDGAGGSVTSNPGGIACSSGTTCTANYASGTSVTLAAQPSSGYAFGQWSGACSGNALTCTVALNSSVAVGASFTSVTPTSSAPLVMYTDALSGPVTGGEYNQGAYLSIFGKNFGTTGLGSTTRVYIGGVEVGNYRYLGLSKVGAKLGIQQITVQVGNLGNPAMGQPLPVKVVVNGVSSNTNNTFTPNPGRILFVAQNGNDSTAVPGDITKPWRNLQTSTRGGAYATLRAGDHIVIRGGNWTDTGFDTAWLRFRDPAQEGSAPTGAAGTGWIHITAYPGQINGNAIEDVHYSTPASMKGGIHGANSAYYGTTGDWVSISNLRIDVNAQAQSDAAPVNLQYSVGPWRVVNNELGPWPSTIAAPNNAKAAGVSGHGANTRVFGNYIHDIACNGALENHGIYVDSGGSGWEIGYNWIQNITGGNLIQFYDNVGLAGNNYGGFPAGWLGFTNMQVHHNWMDGSNKYGLNMAGGILTGSVWNNVIMHSTFAGLRVDTISKNMDMTFAYNTFYDNDRVFSGTGNAQVLNTWGNYNPSGTIRIYDNLFAAGPDTLRSSTYYMNSGNADYYFDFRRNLYWDNGYGWPAFTRDTLAVYGDPKFMAAGSGDLRLGTGSAAVDKATQAVPINVTDDFTSTVPRPQGSANDLGAFEKM
jgi:hypothetical protein